jgi:hypothetical protein
MRDWILKPYNSSIRPMETMQWDELRFSSGGSALETEKRTWNVKTACSTILLKLAANGLQHVFEKWVERCKMCVVCQGRYFEKETVNAPPRSSYSEELCESMNFSNGPLVYLYFTCFGSFKIIMSSFCMCTLFRSPVRLHRPCQQHINLSSTFLFSCVYEFKDQQVRSLCSPWKIVIKTCQIAHYPCRSCYYPYCCIISGTLKCSGL